MTGERAVLFFLFAFALAGCGGGGSSGPPPPPAAPSSLSYTAPTPYTLNVAIAALTPTVTGTPTSYTISPALPAGLSLNAGSGVISGTPTALQAATAYTVSATNAGGSTSATVSITVRDVAPQISYAGGAHMYTTGAPVQALAPTVSGGTVVSWQIDRPLPAGLVFDVTNGTIGGIPTAISASATYVVTATNSGGTDSFDLVLSVVSGLLVELGHVSEIEEIEYSGTRIVSRDAVGRVVLWDADSGAMLFTTVVAPCSTTPSRCTEPVSLAGQTLAINRETGFDLYSSVDGTFLVRVPQLPRPPEEDRPQFFTPTFWSLSSDGNYLVNFRNTGLAAWSRSGTSLLSRTGDHSAARVFAAPNELRVAGGAAAPDALETIAMPAGTTLATVSFIGNAETWFVDGEKFLSNAGPTVLIYSRTGVQLDSSQPPLPTLSELGGDGNFFWGRNTSQLRVYTVGASANPAATYALESTDKVRASGNTLAILRFGLPSVGIIDLAGAAPTLQDYATPTYQNSAYAARSSANWSFGSQHGAMFGELTGATPQRYALGAVRSIAGSSTRVALATDSGDILHFNAATQALEDEIPFSSSKLALSSDGTMLFAAAYDQAAQYGPDRTLRAYSMPSQAVIGEWPAAFGPGLSAPIDFDISDAGDVVAQISMDFVGGLYQFQRRTFRLDGTALWSETFSHNSASVESPIPVRLSPTGTRVGAPYGERVPVTVTNIFENVTLRSATNGWGVGWIDESRMLLNRYAGLDSYDGCVIVNTVGQTVGTCAFPEIRALQRVAPNTIYAPNLNRILNVDTGATIWSSTAPHLPFGAVAGQSVFFASGTTVRVEPR